MAQYPKSTSYLKEQKRLYSKLYEDRSNFENIQFTFGMIILNLSLKQAKSDAIRKSGI